ncbi:MAG: hypothetical protein ACE5HQ_10645 [Gemmatimonadota bacterium]
MTEQADGKRRAPLSALIAGGLVILGLGLSMFVSMGFLVVLGLGAFGPGILRELGWLRDQDEFQRQAVRRAGYHAYLIGGFAAVLVISALKWREANLEGPAGWVMLVLVVLWLTWLFSSLLSYWGARKTASRVLLAFGAFWALFVVGGHLNDPVALLMESLVVAPFFILAWTAGRWPRATGAALLVLSAVAFGFLFDMGRVFIARPGQVLTFVLLLIPMIACGIALLRERHGVGQDTDGPGEAGLLSTGTG